MSSSEQFDDIKKEVRSTLLSFPNGCSFTDFMKDYKNFVRPKFPFEKLGFSNEIECLRAMPDAAKISRSGNDYHLVGIPDEHTKHIKKMVSKQKNAKRKPAARPSRTACGSASKSNSRHKMTRVLPSQMPRSWQRPTQPTPSEILNPWQRPTQSIPSQTPNPWQRPTRAIPSKMLSPWHRPTQAIPSQTQNPWQRAAQAIPSQMSKPWPRTTGVFPSQVLTNSMQIQMQTQMEFRYKSIPREKPKSSQDVPQRREANELSRNFEESGLTFVADTKKSVYEQQNSSINLQTEFNRKEPSVKESKSTTDLRDTGTAPLNSSDTKNKKISPSFGNPHIPEVVKRNLRKVMAKCQSGIWAKEFPSAYKMMTGTDLHLHTMGYQDLASFVEAVPDIIISKTVAGCARDWLIYPPLEEPAVGPSAANPEATALRIDSIISRTRKILLAYMEGVLLQDFLQVYCLNCGEPLYITNLGFDSLENFLRCIADRVPLKFQTDGASTSLHLVLPDEMVTSSVSSNLSNEPSCLVAEYRRTAKAPRDCPFPVHVLSVVDPGHLYIGLKGEDTSDAMLKMNTGMQKFYNECRGDVMGYFAIRSGVAAVAHCSYDSRWYRVKVQSVSSEEGLVQVFCVDYGFLKVVKKVNLRYISEEFLNLPPQALKARLANLKPPKKESRWNPKTKEVIESLCRDVPLLAQVLNVADGVHSVVLCHANKRTSVGERLIREGLAECEPQEALGFQGISDPHLLLQMFWKAYFSLTNMTPADAGSNFLQNPPAPSVDSSGMVQNPSKLPESVEDSDSSDPQDDNCELFDDDADSLFEEFWQKVSMVTKRYVKRVISADGYRFHILIFESKPYVSSGDISTLIWSDKDYNHLQQRPQLKEYLWESITLSDNEEMFEQFTRFHVKGCASNNGISSVVVYPLESVIQILNTFGHPSADLRTKILNERQSFNPLHSKWKELSEAEIPESDEEGCFGGTDDAKLNRLCLYDLQVIKEGIRVKSSKLKSGNPIDEEEKMKLQQLCERVVDRIDQIRHICSNFSSA